LRHVVCAVYAGNDPIQDASFNLEQWVLQKVNQGFRNTINNATMVGDGIDKPLGILNPNSGIQDLRDCANHRTRSVRVAELGDAQIRAAAPMADRRELFDEPADLRAADDDVGYPSRGLSRQRCRKAFQAFRLRARRFVS
jgi:hypothetical protein